MKKKWREKRLCIFCLFLLNILLSLINWTISTCTKKIIGNWTTRYEVLHTLYVLSVLPSGWCLEMEWILGYLLEVKVTWGLAGYQMIITNSALRVSLNWLSLIRYPARPRRIIVKYIYITFTVFVILPMPFITECLNSWTTISKHIFK